MHVEFAPKRGGLLSSKGLELWIDRLIDPQKSFEDLEKKLAIVATDIERGERVIFTSRQMAKHIMHAIKAHSHRFIRSRVVDSCPSIATAVRASCAVPGVFETVQAEGLRLVDGGIVDQVPVEIVRAMGADIVIGVSLGFTRYFENPTRPHQSLSNAWELIGREGIARSLSLADIAVEIPGIETTSLIDLEQRDTFIAQGKAAMRPQIENLKRCVRNVEHKHGQA
jgi:NTE family protein